MKNFFIIITALTVTVPCYAKSSRNHLIKSAVGITKAAASPFYGAFVTGPKNVKETWQYEVNGRENEEERGKFKYRLFSIWRAPGDEAKGIIDGCVDSAKYFGSSIKELLSIFFSD